MKTISDIKQIYARDNGFCEWSDVLYGTDDPAEVDEHFDNVSKLFAKEVAREALRNASENAIMKYHCGHFKTDTPTQYHQQGADNIQIDKQSILNKKNIPEI